MNTRLIRTPCIYLVGFMGCGKTTVGGLLAEDLGWDFVDLDAEIERGAGQTIPEIFEAGGECEFRRLEHEALRARVRAVQTGHATVLSLGGGAFAQENNLALVTDNGISVWLDAPFELIRERITGETHRPLARDPARFAGLYESRRPTYGRADYRVEIGSNDPVEAVEAILALPLF
ncbi:MAG: shikimate kinase [Bryobacteraceae bacterium]